MYYKNFLFVIILIFLSNCTTPNLINNKPNNIIINGYSNKGFALIYNDDLYYKKIVNKRIDERAADASRKYPFTGKSTVTSISFDFLDEGEIILECYNMDKQANKNASFITSTLNQNDSFRTNIRSRVFINYLKKKE